jgi:hypothetical protein
MNSKQQNEQRRRRSQIFRKADLVRLNAPCALSGLANRLDGQSLRDVFRSEMDSDGYFDKKIKPIADAFDAESWGSHRWHT